MAMWRKLATFAVLFALCNANSNPLRNHSLLKAFPKSDNDLESLIKLGEKYAQNVDFWSQPNRLLSPVLFSVSPNVRQSVDNYLNHAQINATLLTNDLKMWVDKEREYLTNNPNTFAALDDSSTFETYHPYEIIVQILEMWEAKYPRNVRFVVIGTTHENRSIPTLIISTDSWRRVKNGTQRGRGASKSVVLFECGIHAREWVSPASCLYIANQLLTNKNDAQLLDKYDFHIIPVANPDGYVFTWESDRSWRRNRYGKYLCVFICCGVDVNRNFDVNHCGKGASPNPCYDTYCGRAPFSEKESIAIRDHVYSIVQSSKIKAYISMHSFSQLWMYPYAYTDSLSSKHDLYDKLSKAAVDAIQRTHGEDYTPGQVSHVLYKASGSSIDWIDVNKLADVTFVVELRDKGNYGFMLPPQFIRPTAEELWNGIKTVIA